MEMVNTRRILALVSDLFTEAPYIYFSSYKIKKMKIKHL